MTCSSENATRRAELTQLRRTSKLVIGRTMAAIMEKSWIATGMDDLDDETRNRDIGFVRVRQGRSSLPPIEWGKPEKFWGETVWSFQLKGKSEVERKRSVGKGVEFFENCRTPLLRYFSLQN